MMRKVVEPENRQNKLLPSSDSEEDAPPDFDYLLKLPSSAGSHFLLKAEQQKFNQQPDQFSKHFSLDTNILNLAVQSIPFHERHENFKIHWNLQELRQMKEEATAFEERYSQSLLTIRNTNEQLSLDVDKSLETVASVEVPAITKHAAPDPDGTENVKSIQKWLDDILEI